MTPARRRHGRHGQPHRQRGLATLIIVAVLFFALSLVTAYTNRNLIFEQRTASNQFRSTLALEAAEAGTEWAISQLNSGLIDGTCLPSDDVTQRSFRQRYLAINPDNGIVTPVADRSTSCVSDGAGGWNCSCPDSNTPAPDAGAGAGIRPAFRARLTTVVGVTPGLVRLEVAACTTLVDTCLRFPNEVGQEAVGNEGRVTTQVLLALRNGLAAAPQAAITLRGGLDMGGAALGAYNPDAASGGYAIHAGGDVDETNLRLGTAPGTPTTAGRVVLKNDPTIDTTALPEPDRLFSSTFATQPAVYRAQPGAVFLDCSGGCIGDAVRDAAARNPGRVLWIEGDIALDGGTDIGSPDQPLMMVVDGSASIETDVFGVLYVRENAAGDPWDASGAGQLNGALIVEGDMEGTATFTVLRDLDVLNAIQRNTGSFVRVPGSWRDF